MLKASAGKKPKRVAKLKQGLQVVTRAVSPRGQETASAGLWRLCMLSSFVNLICYIDLTGPWHCVVFPKIVLIGRKRLRAAICEVEPELGAGHWHRAALGPAVGAGARGQGVRGPLTKLA